jgi:MFS family permease
MFATAGFTLLVPLAPDLYAVIGLAVVIGFFSQLYRPAGGAILVDTVEPELRVSAFGLLRLATNLGMSIGPVIGGVLSGVSYDYLFIGNAVASALFGILVLVMLPETKPQDEPAADGGGGDRARGGYQQVFGDRSMRLYLLATFIASYVYIQTTSTLPLHVRDEHLPNSFYALLLAINAAVIVALELPIISFTSRRHPARVFAIGLGLLSLGVGLTGVADSRAAMVLTVVTWTFGEMIYTPVSTTYPGLLAPGQLRGRYQGAEGIAMTLGQTVGPALGGLLYSVSLAGHWASCAILALVAAGIILCSGDPRERAAPPRSRPGQGSAQRLVPADAD